MASITRPMASPHAMAYTEWVLRSLKETGLAPAGMVHCHLTVFVHAQGLAMAADVETQAQQDTGMSDDEWMARNEPQFSALSAGGAYPLLNTLFTKVDPDELFEFGLQRMLDGIAVMIAETSA